MSYPPGNGYMGHNVVSSALQMPSMSFARERSAQSQLPADGSTGMLGVSHGNAGFLRGPSLAHLDVGESQAQQHMASQPSHFASVGGMHLQGPSPAAQGSVASRAGDSVARAGVEPMQGVQELQLKVSQLEQLVETHWRLLERLPNVNVVFDLDGIISFVTPASERELGYSIPDLCSKPLATIIHPDARQAFEDAVRDMLSSTAAAQAVLPTILQAADGSAVPCMASGRAWTAQNGVDIVFSFMPNAPPKPLPPGAGDRFSMGGARGEGSGAAATAPAKPAGGAGLPSEPPSVPPPGGARAGPGAGAGDAPFAPQGKAPLPPSVGPSSSTLRPASASASSSSLTAPSQGAAAGGAAVAASAALRAAASGGRVGTAPSWSGSGAGGRTIASASGDMSQRWGQQPSQEQAGNGHDRVEGGNREPASKRARTGGSG